MRKPATWNMPVGRWPILPSCSRDGLLRSALPKMDRDAADDKRMKSQALLAACAACGGAPAWAERLRARNGHEGPRP